MGGCTPGWTGLDRPSAWRGWYPPSALAVKGYPCLCIVWEHCTSSTGMLGLISSACPPASWLKHCWAALLQLTTSPSGQMCLENTLHTGRARIQLLAWAWANWTLGPEKLLFSYRSGRYAPCPISWSECTSSLVMQMSRTAVGITVWAPQVSVSQGLCAGCHEPLPASLSQCLSPTDCPTIPMLQRSEWWPLQSNLQCWRRALAVSHGFFLPARGTGDSGAASLRGGVLAWGRGSAVSA